MEKLNKKWNNRGMLLYVCRDCKAKKYIKTAISNRRGGIHCMSCGGILDPDSNNARGKAANARSRSNGEETGSFLINHK